MNLVIKRINEKLQPLNYHLNPCLSIAEVETFEKTYGIRLPKGYRNFLTYLGNGGEGPPFYGLLKLGTQPSDFKIKYDKKILQKPFPFTETWIWDDQTGLTEEPSEEELEKVDHGMILLGNDGCAQYWFLVITGPERGNVWYLTGTGIIPCNEVEGYGAKRDFLSWYEAWLDNPNRQENCFTSEPIKQKKHRTLNLTIPLDKKVYQQLKTVALHHHLPIHSYMEQLFQKQIAEMPIPSIPTQALDLVKLFPKTWKNSGINQEFNKPYMKELEQFIEQELSQAKVFPKIEHIFAAFEATPFEDLNVLILGQDPYHNDGQAHGLSFSVQPGIKTPPSLKNMYKELHSDLGCTVPNNGYLMPWAKQGVLLLNAVLTVRAHQAASHKNKGWEKFTDAVIQCVNLKKESVVFVLWGGFAKKKKRLISHKHHVIIEGVHPSPLSARHGFFGSRPFSSINQALKANGKPEINWQIPTI